MGKKKSTPGRELYNAHFGFFAPEREIERLDPNEIPRAKRLFRRTVSELLDRLVCVFGRESVEDRVEDLARHNPIVEDCIPLAYVPKPEHSHNIAVGVPYTGVFIGRSTGLPFIVPHEVGHIVFGKFNDGLAEPIASLFLGQASASGPKGKKGKGKTGKGKKGKGKGSGNGSGSVQAPPLRPGEFVTLAILELFQQGAAVLDMRCLADLVSHRPTDRRIAQCRFEHEGGATDPRGAAERTQQFISNMIRTRYHADFVNHDSLAMTRPSDAEVLEIESWITNLRLDGFHILNPNEDSGVARDLRGAVDTTLMNFLLDKGLDGGRSGPPDPAAARESVGKLFEFYFDVDRGLAAYGYRDFAELETDLRESLATDLERLPDEQMFAWFQMKDNIVQSPCYQPGRWYDPACRGGGAGRFSHWGQPVEEFMELVFPPRPGGGGGPRPLDPIIDAALKAPPPKTPLLSLTERLGKDLDFQTHFSLY